MFLRPGARIDWAGLVTFSAGPFFLVYALIRGNDDGWGSAKIVPLLIVAALLIAIHASMFSMSRYIVLYTQNVLGFVLMSAVIGVVAQRRGVGDQQHPAVRSARPSASRVPPLPSS